MTAAATSRVPAVDAGYVRQRAAALVARGRERVEILRAAPEPARATSFQEGGSTVHVRPCVSALAVLDAYEQLPAGDYLVVLTDRSEHDLGDTVLLQARGRKVHVVDPWSEVPGLFGARTADRELRALGTWAADALVAHRPADGWPQITSGTLTATHALGNLLARLLGQRLPSTLDEVSIVVRLDERDGRLAWQQVDPSLRRHLTQWAGRALGPAARFALAVAAERQAPVTAVGLAVDVLWPGAERDGLPVLQAQMAARVRVEPVLGGVPVAADDARRLADVARVVALRREAEGDPDLGRVLEAAEEVLEAVGWAAGADRSDILRAGLRARLRHLAGALQAGLDSPDQAGGAEGPLADLLEHRLARSNDREVTAARMAVRLLRWLSHAEGGAAEVPAALTTALWQQVDDGAWVDRAVAAVWSGSADPEIGATYRALYERVTARRRARDAAAAEQLARAMADDTPLAGVVPLETFRERVLAPLSASHEVLLVVVDGMSAAVATEIVESAVGRGWTELLPPAADRRAGRRAVGLAVLPSMTTYSRTSLFTGELTAGTRDAEKQRWRADLQAQVFHKGDLATEAGALLPDALLAAINAPGPVGVVLNTVDDALMKADPGGTSWTDDTVQHLRPLLDAAYLAGRVVVLTADHGHVVERGSRLVSTPGAEARWRPVDSGPVQDGEVLVQGRRVLASGGRAVLAWDEGLRYGNRAAGYHGGASLAEITVPIVVLARGADAEVAGWRPGPPQAPAWWNDPVAVRPEPVVGGRRARRAGGPEAAEAGAPDSLTARKGRAKAAPEGQGMLGFDVAEVNAPPETARPATLVDAVMASPTYREQKARAGRHALDDAVVRTVLDALVSRGGRAHRDTLAAAAQVSTVTAPGMLAALRRLLNVEGYAVVQDDVDGVTVVLDQAALRQQFELEV